MFKIISCVMMLMLSITVSAQYPVIKTKTHLLFSWRSPQIPGVLEVRDSSKNRIILRENISSATHHFVKLEKLKNFPIMYWRVNNSEWGKFSLKNLNTFNIRTKIQGQRMVFDWQARLNFKMKIWTVSHVVVCIISEGDSYIFNGVQGESYAFLIEVGGEKKTGTFTL